MGTSTQLNRSLKSLTDFIHTQQHIYAKLFPPMHVKAPRLLMTSLVIMERQTSYFNSGYTSMDFLDCSPNMYIWCICTGLAILVSYMLLRR